MARRAQSRHRRRDRENSQLHHRGYRSCDAKRAGGIRGPGVGRHGYSRARPPGQSARRRVRGQPGSAVPARDAEQRPAGQRNPRAALAVAGFLPLLRRPCAGAPRRGHSRRRPLSELHVAHADRHGGQLDAVQSPADDHVQVAGGGVGFRLRHRGQAVGIHPADDAAAGRISSPRPACHRAYSMSCSGSAQLRARCWPSTRASTSWC